MFRCLIGRPELDFALDFEWRFPSGTQLAIRGEDGYSGLVFVAPIEQNNRVSDYQMPPRGALKDFWNKVQDDITCSFGLSGPVGVEIDFDLAIEDALSFARSQ